MLCMYIALIIWDTSNESISPTNYVSMYVVESGHQFWGNEILAFIERWPRVGFVHILGLRSGLSSEKWPSIRGTFLEVAIYVLWNI